MEQKIEEKIKTLNSLVKIISDFKKKGKKVVQ